MELNSFTKVHDLIEKYPFLLDFLADYNPKFSLLKNTAMRATMGRMAKLSMVAEIGGIPLDTLISDIAEEIKSHTNEPVIIEKTGESPSSDKDKLERLKEIIRSLHRGEDFSKVKAEFDNLMNEIDPTQIASMEEQLIREGMPAEEIQRLCDLHVSMFKDILDDHEEVDMPPGHPVHTYMEENKYFSEVIASFDKLTKQIPSDDEPEKQVEDIKKVISKLSLLDKHYIRKENQLFPYLEKHGITGPSQVMWGIHNEIRGMIKEVKTAVDSHNMETLSGKAASLSRAIIEMIYKENSILFPLSIDTLSEKEWIVIRRGEDEVGYVSVTPGKEWPIDISDVEITPAELKRDNQLNLDTGILSLDQINLLLKHLPVEVSFVDEKDEVRYYSDTQERIFPRSPGVIGRAVQNCHPPNSIHIVNSILDAFKAGERDSAEFWIEMDNRLIYIRYFAVRDIGGTYKGTIEVTEDITNIRNIKGEKRLLNWD